MTQGIDWWASKVLEGLFFFILEGDWLAVARFMRGYANHICAMFQYPYFPY